MPIDIQEIYDALAEAFAIFRQLQEPAGITAVGPLLAQVMAAGGLGDEALEVLDEVEAAFETLGDADGLEQVRQLRDEMAKDR